MCVCVCVCVCLCVYGDSVLKDDKMPVVRRANRIPSLIQPNPSPNDYASPLARSRPRGRQVNKRRTGLGAAPGPDGNAPVFAAGPQPVVGVVPVVAAHHRGVPAFQRVTRHEPIGHHLRQIQTRQRTQGKALLTRRARACVCVCVEGVGHVITTKGNGQQQQQQQLARGDSKQTTPNSVTVVA